MSPFNNWKIIVILCLTLGLAPYFPEPHIVGKIRWIAGGATGMKLMDWFDTVIHGFPFILLIIFIVNKFSKKNAS
jgi:hypothetical protein